MNKTALFSGLGMQLINAALILAYFALPYLDGISIEKLIGITVYVIFNIASFIFMIWGLVEKD